VSGRGRALTGPVVDATKATEATKWGGGQREDVAVWFAAVTDSLAEGDERAQMCGGHGLRRVPTG